MEKEVQIACDDIFLEGRFQGEGRTVGVVVTHPHPLYGGNMDNPVVQSLARAFYDAGCASLRFNFRGTDGSKGTHDHGNGEQADIQAAISYLQGQGAETILLAGYSFGAWVGTRLLTSNAENGITACWMVSPPVDFIEFPEKDMACPCHIITGADDTLGAPDAVRSYASDWFREASLDVVQHTDHFWMGNGLYEITPWVRQTVSPYMTMV